MFVIRAATSVAGILPWSKTVTSVLAATLSIRDESERTEVVALTDAWENKMARRHEAPPDVHGHVLIRVEREFTVEPKKGRDSPGLVKNVEEDGSEKILRERDVYLRRV
jgi:hypothetical protein